MFETTCGALDLFRTDPRDWRHDNLYILCGAAALCLELPLYLLEHQIHATFKEVVLRDQEELDGPPQHSIFRTSMSHGSSDVFRALLQLPTLEARLAALHKSLHLS